MEKGKGQIERNVRRIIWRWGETDQDWEILAYDRVTFGDVEAALALELSKKMAAGLGIGIDPVASEIILGNTYVDDTAGSGTKAEVDRMKGKELEDGTYSGTLSQIFNLVGLKPKVIVCSGEDDPKKLEKIGKVLGLEWSPMEDTLSMGITVNLTSKMSNGERKGPDLQVEDIRWLRDQAVLTRRN